LQSIEAGDSTEEKMHQPKLAERRPRIHAEAVLLREEKKLHSNTMTREQIKNRIEEPKKPTKLFQEIKASVEQFKLQNPKELDDELDGGDAELASFLKTFIPRP
jgi:hypothetical protein